MEARWVAFRPGGAPAGNSSQRALLPSSRLSLKSLVWWPRPGPGDRGVSGQRQAFPRQQPRDSWRSWRSRLGTEAGVWGSGLLSSPCGKGRRQVRVGVAEPVGAAVFGPRLCGSPSSPGRQGPGVALAHFVTEKPAAKLLRGVGGAEERRRDRGVEEGVSPGSVPSFTRKGQSCPPFPGLT